jgi:Raf kinase inhibitor-like YbhB/YbcL family protein
MSQHSPQDEATRAIDYINLHVSSPSFEQDGLIPERYTCDGENINPPLEISHIPEKSVCLTLIVDDPDAPGGTWVHWTVWNIPVTHHLKENEVHGLQGRNDFGQHHYGGPCPPSGTHRYFFKVYALDTLLAISGDSTKADVEKAMAGHIIAFGELTGLYHRIKK